jgi:hypothetical protein
MYDCDSKPPSNEDIHNKQNFAYALLHCINTCTGMHDWLDTVGMNTTGVGVQFKPSFLLNYIGLGSPARCLLAEECRGRESGIFQSLRAIQMGGVNLQPHFQPRFKKR